MREYRGRAAVSQGRHGHLAGVFPDRRIDKDYAAGAADRFHQLGVSWWTARISMAASWMRSRNRRAACQPKPSSPRSGLP